MATSPEQRLPGITRYGLRVHADELDNALVRFTEPSRRRFLNDHLFLYSYRFFSVDTMEKYNESTPTLHRLQKVTGLANNLNDIKGEQRRLYGLGEHGYKVLPTISKVYSEDEARRRLTLRFDVSLGTLAYGGVLNPDLYRFARREEIDARDHKRTLRSTIPERELLPEMARHGVVTFRYTPPHLVDDLVKPLAYLHEALKDSLEVNELAVSSEVHPLLPLSHEPKSFRSQDLLNGHESAQYISIHALKNSIDRIHPPHLKDVS